MGRPVIGVFPQYQPENNRLMIGVPYFKCISAAGGIPVILPLHMTLTELEELLERMDGFLYPGGPDPNPLLYGEEAEPECGNIILERDRLELESLPMVLATGKPVLGVCRGIQVMNVALGGTLIQDIPTWLERQAAQSEARLSETRRLEDTQSEARLAESRLLGAGRKDNVKERVGHYQKAGDSVQTHRVQVEKNTLLYDIVRKNTLLVNSFHHQVCKELAAGFVQNATSTDGIIEAAALEKHPFFLGVQWHPEHLYGLDADMKKIWHAFINSASAGK